MRHLRYVRHRAASGVAAVVVLLGGGLPGAVMATPARLSAVHQPSASSSFDALIAEAARRFGVPHDWIHAVMRQESAFDPRATSRAGAMGLMQIMPATYAELRRCHGLGPDPYDARDNVLAGTAYLRELRDRFGPIGMLAAYNAGPGRYLEYRDGGRPLPAETRDYIARIAPRLGVSHVSRPSRSPRPDGVDLAASPLFPARPAPMPAAADGLFVLLADPAAPEPETRP